MDYTLFTSDNHAAVHPNIMQALLDANHSRQPAYGEDIYTLKASDLFKSLLGDIEVYMTFNGTGTNVIALQSCLRCFNAVLCSEHAHLAVHECGAPEHTLGCKLITIPSSDGKLTVSSIESALVGVGSVHYSQPRVVSLTQPTELGAVYTVDEMTAIVEYCHQYGLYVHVDGARICNAVAALGVSFKEAISDTKIDVLSFGGTKNGAMLAEAAVFFNSDLAQYTHFIRKEFMQLASKMRYISAQFIALFENDLWLKNAENANKMAIFLADKLLELPGVSIPIPPRCNIIYVNFPSEFLLQIQERYKLLQLGNKLRFVVSFDSNKTQINDFIKDLKVNFFN